MIKSHDTLVNEQFSPRAQAYVDSPVHSRGEDLDRIEKLALDARPANALDLGTGGGHVAYRLAQHAKRVSAIDLSEDMLTAVKATALSKGLSNIDVRRAAVEQLPFADAAFDFVACRFSAHHWRDLEAGLREARRVVAKQSRAIFVDAYSPGAALLDTHLQTIEILRDTSHVRDYTIAQWLEGLARSGFTIQATRTWRIPIEFASWIARMRTPPDLVRAIRALQTIASDEVRRYFKIEADGSFELDAFMVETVAS
jgi:ubiquinone/menaquinone biosynthesis C-methylase UbiE